MAAIEAEDASKATSCGQRVCRRSGRSALVFQGQPSLLLTFCVLSIGCGHPGAVRRSPPAPIGALAPPQDIEFEVFERDKLVASEKLRVETSTATWTLKSVFRDKRLDSVSRYALRVDTKTMEVLSIQGSLEIGGEKRTYRAERQGPYFAVRFSSGKERRVPFGPGTFLETALPSSAYFAARRIPFSRQYPLASTRAVVVDELRGKAMVFVEERRWVLSEEGGGCVRKRRFSSHFPDSILCVDSAGMITALEEGSRRWRLAKKAAP